MDGIITVYARWTLVRDAHGKPKSILAINTDITEMKKLESKFLRAQRMEGIGTLASGMAHDLNNILAPILLATEMLKTSVTDPEDVILLTTLGTSARRGAELVKQVLSFARGMEGDRTVVNSFDLMRDFADVIRETFPKSIDIRAVFHHQGNRKAEVMLRTLKEVLSGTESGFTVEI